MSLPENDSLGVPTHFMPRRLLEQPTFMFGLNAPQTFSMVGTGVLLISTAVMVKDLFVSLGIIIGALIVVAIMFITFRIINNSRRSFLSHNFGYLRMKRKRPKRYTGRGEKYVW